MVEGAVLRRRYGGEVVEAPLLGGAGVVIRDEQLTPRAIAKKLDITIDAVRCLLNSQPAPLNPRQQRAGGRLARTLSEQLPAEELKQLHQHERISVQAIGQRFGVSKRLIVDLLESYGIPRLRRQALSIDAAWLHHEYITQRRTLPDIAAELGIAVSYLNRRAKGLGVPLRNHGGNAHGKPRFGPHQVKLAREMLDSGDYTVRQIAEDLGFTSRTVYRHLRLNRK